MTHGLRHFAFLTYVAVLYLAALRSVRIRAAYYGMLNRHPSPSQFLDLRPLLDLPRWVHALEVLRDTGSTLPMATTLRDGPDSQPARDSARDLTALSEAYLSSLPLEFGVASVERPRAPAQAAAEAAPKRPSATACRQAGRSTRGDSGTVCPHLTAGGCRVEAADRDHGG